MVSVRARLRPHYYSLHCGTNSPSYKEGVAGETRRGSCRQRRLLVPLMYQRGAPWNGAGCRKKAMFVIGDTSRRSTPYSSSQRRIRLSGGDANSFHLVHEENFVLQCDGYQAASPKNKSFLCHAMHGGREMGK